MCAPAVEIITTKQTLSMLPGTKLFLLLPPLAAPAATPSTVASAEADVGDVLGVGLSQSAVETVGEALGRVLLPHPRDFVLQWGNSTNTAEEIWAAVSGSAGHTAGACAEEAVDGGLQPPVGSRTIGSWGQKRLQWVVLTPGDALFIPCNWWHATLNIGETVAVGGQQLQASCIAFI